MALSQIIGSTGIVDATITSAKLADFSAAVDLNGVELLLDADQDTSITADTDDQIDFKIAGVEHISLTNSSGDTIIKPRVDAKDIVFQQFDGNKILEINDGNFVGIGGNATAAGQIRIYEDTDNGSHYSGFTVGNLTASVAYQLPNADGSSGQALITDGSGVLSFTTLSANTPSSADGQALGSASLEWSDLFLADAGTIQFGNDQDIRLIHNADKGLILKHTATADDKPVILTLQTGETDMAANDVIGKIEFQAPDEGTGTDAILVSAAIQAVAEGDHSSSSNATRLEFMTGASEAAAVKMAIASDGDVGIGTTSPLGQLHIKTGAQAGTPNVDADADELVLESNGNCGLNILSPQANAGKIAFSDDGDADVGRIIYDHSDNSMAFTTSASEQFRIITAGNLTYAKTSDDFGTVGITLYGETGSGKGHLQVTTSGAAPLALNRLSNDGTLLDFYQAGGYEGNVSVSGSTVSYNTFCGSHWTRLADNSKPTILRGTVMESIATMCDWYQAVAQVAESTDKNGNVTPAHDVKQSIFLPDGKSVGDAVTFTSQGKEYTGVYVKEDNEQLPMCKISDTADSKAVYGVFMTWDDADDGLDGDVNDMNVASLGAFVVRVHKDETVAIGNWLVSKGDGTAKVLAGDTAITADVQSSLIGKVTSTTKTHTHADDSYCVPCTLHCG